MEAHLLQKSINDAGPMPPMSGFGETRSFSRPQQYRDRAKERRNMFGLDPSGNFFTDTAAKSCCFCFAMQSISCDFFFLGFTNELSEDPGDYAVRSQDVPLDESNIGNKLLKSMGWTEGTGIGKNSQG